ncbi:MAG: hypothetical protein LBR60_07465 [Fibrobacter sp.]|jgi:long-chain fatty acid transport protein|nr:hypothetical protein [Fibrobacter sp.]
MKYFGLLLFFAAVSAHAVSLIGTDALGQGNDGARFGNAKTEEGLSMVNPARLAFERKVSFSAVVNYEVAVATKGDDTYASDNVEIPSLAFIFPLGRFGALSVGVWQHYSANMSTSVTDSSNHYSTEVEYRGSLFELTPSYALRLPFLRRVSLGGTVHFVMGANSRRITLGPDKSNLAPEDTWASTDAKITDAADGDWKIKNHPAYYTGSIQYAGRSVEYFFSYTTPYTLRNKLKYDLQFSQLDTLRPSTVTREIEMPATFATGVNFKFMKVHNIMLDVLVRNWDDAVPNIAGGWNLPDETEVQRELSVGGGYQRDGSDLAYESYVNRTSFRLGAWYRSWYIKDVNEFGGSLGVGLPLGIRGTKLDVSIHGGYRTAEKPNWDESFFGVSVGLIGVGNWGQPSRRYR